MSPRNYDMGKRATAVAQTRRRIVDATRELHTERGIARTSWDDIAARAGVGLGTVYRHFPTLDELAPACGAVSMEIAAIPAPQDAPALFDGLAGAAERLGRLASEVFGIYERAAGELHVARREPEAHPSVAGFAAEVERALAALVDAALAPLDASAEDRALTRALIDLGTWEALRRSGLDAPAAAAAMRDLLAARLAA
jgi:AcrR family transcriptional regulator